MDDLLREFLTETSENIAKVDSEIVRLEQNPNDPALLGDIFRLVHTIKGTCGFLDCRGWRCCSCAETCSGNFAMANYPSRPPLSVLSEIHRHHQRLLATLEETEAEAPGQDDDLIADLNAVANGNPRSL